MNMNRNRNRINLFVQTERSIDLLGINASITTENTEFTHQKNLISIPKNLISKNMNNIDQSFDINLKNDIQQTKNNKNIPIVSNRTEITKAPEKNRASAILATPINRSQTEKSTLNLKRYGIKNISSFLSTSITNYSAYKINPAETFEGN